MRIYILTIYKFCTHHPSVVFENALWLISTKRFLAVFHIKVIFLLKLIHYDRLMHVISLPYYLQPRESTWIPQLIGQHFVK